MIENLSQYAAEPEKFERDLLVIPKENFERYSNINYTDSINFQQLLNNNKLHEEEKLNLPEEVKEKESKSTQEETTILSGETEECTGDL